MNIQFCKSKEEIESNRAIWDELYWSTECPSTMSYEWISTALKYYPRDNRLFIGIINDGNHPIAIVPLEISEGKTGPFKHNTLQFLLEGWSNRNGALVGKNIDELSAIIKAVYALREENSKWTYCELSKLPASLFLHTTKKKYQPNKYLVPMVIGRSVVIDLPDTFEIYRQSLSKAHKKNISRKTNSLDKKGQVFINDFNPTSHLNIDILQKLIDDAVKISTNSWQHTAPTGRAISHSDTVGFFSEVSRKLAIKKMLSLSVLYLDSEPISFIWGDTRGVNSSIFKLGFNQSYSDFSPGIVHIAKYIESAIIKGIKKIDFGHEFIDYKSHWGKQYDELVNLYIYPKGITPSFIRWFRGRRLLPSAVPGVFEHKYNKLKK